MGNCLPIRSKRHLHEKYTKDSLYYSLIDGDEGESPPGEVNFPRTFPPTPPRTPPRTSSLGSVPTRFPTSITSVPTVQSRMYSPPIPTTHPNSVIPIRQISSSDKWG